MIIDLILDRQQGELYNARNFYIELLNYDDTSISKAMDFGTEEEVKKALKDYVIENDYSIDILDYINSVNWLK